MSIKINIKRILSQQNVISISNLLLDAKKLRTPFNNIDHDALQDEKMSNIVLSRKSTFERQQENNSEKVNMQ